MSETTYDRIGIGYADTRRADPRIAARIEAALGDARSVVNIGAGAGSYEPAGRNVTAVEPSAEMIAQRPPGAAPAVRASAESLPFDDDSFDAALAVLTAHHWPDLDAGLSETLRVARGRIVIVTFDSEALKGLWIAADYFPEMLGLNAPPGQAVATWWRSCRERPAPRSRCRETARTTSSRRSGHGPSCCSTRRSCGRCGCGRASRGSRDDREGSGSPPTWTAAPGSSATAICASCDELDVGLRLVVRELDRGA